MVFPMSEKLIESITHKCTSDERLDLEAIAAIEKISLSELIRKCCKARISAEKERLHILSRLMRHTTETAVTPHFELAPEPALKHTGTKKAQLCDQLSLIAMHNQSYE